MQQAWKDFIQNNSIDSVLDVKESAIICPLSDFALLSITGEDRQSFLHGQFINDLNLIEKPSAQISAWCNPKGQVITNFIIINTGISYLLIFKKELKEYVQKRLTMFVLRSDVKVADISESSPLVGIANNDKLSVLSSNIPASAGEVVADDGLVVIRHPDNSGRHLLTGSIEALTKKLPDLNTKLSSSSAWELLDILSGLPWITSETQEKFLPQMLNLDALNGLSYQKGCYPGQEVIARLHYRGEVKKRIQIIKSEHKLTIGSDITASDSKVGTIINSSNAFDRNYYGLVVIELDKLVAEIFSDEGNELNLLDLPYKT